METLQDVVKAIEESNSNWFTIAKLIGIDQNYIEQIKKLTNNSKLTEKFVQSLTISFWKRIFNYVDIQWNGNKNIAEVTNFHKISNILIFNWRNVSLNDYEMTIIKGIASKVSEWRRFGRILGFSTPYLNKLEKDFSFLKERNMEMMKSIRQNIGDNTTWEYWRNYLNQFDDGKVVIEEMETENLQLFNEVKNFDSHILSSRSYMYFGHPINIYDIELLSAKNKNLRIKVPVGTKDFHFQEYQTISEWMETKQTYWSTYPVLNKIKAFDFTDASEQLCPILSTLKRFLVNTNDGGFICKGYNFSKHIGLFKPGMFARTDFNDHYFCYIANSNIVLYITRASKGTSNALIHSKKNIQIANILHVELQSNAILQINVVAYSDDNNTEFCKACVENKLYVEEDVFTNDKKFLLWYNEILHYSHQNVRRLKGEKTTKCGKPILKSMFCYEAIECEDLPSFSTCCEDQMEEQKKLVLLTPAQYEALRSPNKHIILKGAYGSGKSLVLLKRFENVVNNMSDSNIAYLVCQDQQSKFVDYMRERCREIPQRNITICRSSDLIGCYKVPKLSVLLGDLRDIFAKHHTIGHIFIDEFSGTFLDHEEILKLQGLLKHFTNSYISISLQSMEERVDKCKAEEFFDIGYQLDSLIEKTSFVCYHLDYSMRNSYEINSFINATAKVMESRVVKIEDNNSFLIDKIYVDKEQGREKNVYNRGSNAIRLKYNQSNINMTTVRAGPVEVYCFDKDMSSVPDAMSVIYTSTLLYLLKTESDSNSTTYVICTYDEYLYDMVHLFLENNLFVWTNKIDQFSNKGSKFKVLLTDYASVRGYEFPNFIFLVPFGSKFLRYRLIECFSRATTKLYIIADNMKKSTFFFDFLYEDENFDSLDKELLEVWKSLADVSFIHIKYSKRKNKISLIKGKTLFMKGDIIYTQENVNGKMVEKPVNRYPWSNHPTQVYSKSDLHTDIEDVVRTDNINLFRQYVDTSIHVTTYGTKLLHLAAKFDTINILKLLLDSYKININCANEEKETALHIAARCSSIKAMEQLLFYKADMNVKDKYGLTPLQYALRFCHFQAFNILADNKANFHVKDSEGNTPLHEASWNGYLKVARILVNNNADVNLKNNYDDTPLHFASRDGHLQIVEIILNNKANVNAKDLHGNTPLHLASRSNRFQIVEMLLSKKADVNLRDSDGNAPHHHASWNGHLQVVKILFNNKADVTAANKYGDTALHAASRYGHSSVVEIIANKKADVNATDIHGNMPLHLASKYNHIEVVSVLIDKNADVNAKDNGGNAPLHEASYKGHLQIVEKLLKNEADPNIRNNDCDTPLHSASFCSHLDVVEILINNGACINAKGSHGNTSLHLASRYNHIKLAEILLNNNVDVNVEDKNGSTPLHEAALNGHKQIVELLLNNKADVHAKDIDGYTPLHLASRNGHFQVVSMLKSNSEDTVLSS